MNKFFSSTRRIIACLSAAALLAVIPLAGCDQSDKDKDKDKNDNSSASATDGQSESENDKYKGVAVVKSENYKINYHVIQYLMNYMVSDFCNSYGTSYFDTTKDLREQYYNEDEKITWYDYFYDTTKNYITQIMVFAEEGKKNGLELSESELEQLDSTFEQMESVAAESSMTLDEFIAGEYGGNVTKSEVEEIQKMTVLARDYSNYLYKSFEYTDEDYEKQYKENKESYEVADFLMYSFGYSEEETSTVPTKDVAKESADALASAKNEKEFNEYLEKYLRDNPLYVSVPTSSESSVTEEDFNAGVEAAIESAKNEKIAYDVSTECYKWVFDENRKANDVTVIDENNAYNVILVTKPIYRDESETRNIRHILIKFGTDDDADAKAKESADKIYREWKDGKKTEETFAELANKYSEDPGSNTNGGLYENVEVGYMVESFNDWMFDPNRKVGDNAIVKTEIGYHIMYYPGPGLAAWKVPVDSDLRENDVSEEYENLKKKHEIEFDDEALQTIEIELPETSTATQ